MFRVSPDPAPAYFIAFVSGLMRRTAIRRAGRFGENCGPWANRCIVALSVEQLNPLPTYGRLLSGAFTQGPVASKPVVNTYGGFRNAERISAMEHSRPSIRQAASRIGVGGTNSRSRIVTRSRGRQFLHAAATVYQIVIVTVPSPGWTVVVTVSPEPVAATTLSSSPVPDPVPRVVVQADVVV